MIVSSLSGFSTGNSRGEMVQGIVEEKWYRE